MSEEQCKTRLLEDKPAEDDAFSAPEQLGAHDRVARAVVGLIESTEDGKVIGLEGSWGAGKSTVVKMICRMLADSSSRHSTQVITFDAWAHEGDPLRRTYLETLIRQLQHAGWIQQKKWDTKVDEIANRRRVTEARTIPKPTVLGTLIALTLLLVPLGTVCLKHLLEEEATLSFGWHLPVYWAAIGTPFALGPLLVLLGYALWILINRPNGSRRFWAVDNWAFLEGKTISTTTTETVETPNPTSLEFEKYFDELMTDAIAHVENRRVVLILDNLDRVDPKSALEIWSTLQTFLQHHERRSEKWFRRLWIVVPFDPIGIRSLWENRNQKGAGEKTEGESDLMADSFLDKTFPIRFSVPPLVASDWKVYLQKLVTEALPAHPIEDTHAIYRVFNHFRPRAGDPPTPRQLKLFVNQIGAIHRQWQDTFPLAHVAYFVLVGRDRQELIKNLREAVEPSKDARRMLGLDLQANLAGLAFNLSAARGQEVLLADPIYEALSSGDAQKLKDLGHRHGEGFWSTLDHVAQERFSAIAGITVGKIAVALNGSELLQGNARIEIPLVRRSVLDAAEEATSETWGAFDDACAHGLVALAHLANDFEYSQKVLAWTAQILELSAKRNPSQPVDPGVAIQGIYEVLTAVEALGHASATSRRFSLPLDAEGWKAACQDLSRRDPKFWPRIQPQVSPVELISVLSATIAAGQFSEQDLTMIAVSYASANNEQWAPITQAILQRLHAGQNPEGADIEILVRTLWKLQLLGVPEVRSALAALVDGGHAMHYFVRPSKKNNVRFQALLILTYLVHRPDASKAGSIGNSEVGHQRFIQALGTPSAELAQELANLAREYQTIDWLFACYAARGTHDALLDQCLRELAGRNRDPVLLSVAVVLAHWKALKGALDADLQFRSFIEQMVTGADLIQGIVVNERGFSIGDIELYSSLVEIDQDRQSEFSCWCARGLEGLDSGTWSSDFSTDFSACRLAIVLHRRETDLQLGVGFKDALVEHANSVADGNQIPPSDLRVEWSRLPHCLHPLPLQQEFSKSIVRLATKRDGKIDSAFFSLYGDSLADADALTSNSDVIAQLFSRGLKDDAPIEWLQWLHCVLRTSPRVWETHKQTSAAEEFRLRLRSRISSPENSEASALVHEIGAMLGIERSTAHDDPSLGQAETVQDSQ